VFSPAPSAQASDFFTRGESWKNWRVSSPDY
jgi:hypothetical protein